MQMVFRMLAEVGVGGVTVDLYDGGGNFVATTTTAADGSYNFTNLTPGDYYVDFYFTKWLCIQSTRSGW